MRKKNVFILSVLAISFAFGFSSCQKEEVDIEQPTITLNSPTAHAVLTIGDEHGVHLDMELADNVALSSYKINIHANFDGHHHAPRQKAPSISAQNDSVPFEFTKIWTDINGQKTAKIHHHEIIIPKELNGKPVKTGDYHLIIYCLDKAGNESYTAVEMELSYSSNDETNHIH